MHYTECPLYSPLAHSAKIAPIAVTLDMEQATPDTDKDALPSRWEDLLHVSVREAALPQFRNGHWRDAQLNAVMAVLEVIRARTGLQLDGDQLITRVFGQNQPLLTVGDLTTPSGRDAQLGFMLVLQGMNKGTRNPRAHSLAHDLNALRTAQYLVFASLLARRVAEATAVTPPTETSTRAP
jgi:uncharacterized protein (TIGR02391 family)